MLIMYIPADDDDDDDVYKEYRDGTAQLHLSCMSDKGNSQSPAEGAAASDLGAAADAAIAAATAGCTCGTT